jgi:hypothetical protein
VSALVRPSLWRRIKNSLRTWPRGTLGTIDMIPDGFVFTDMSGPVQIRWREITQIDGGVRDYLTVDMFFTVIHAANERVSIDEVADGFRQLEHGIFEQWPRLRQRWLALQGALPRHPQFETLWKRRP